MNPITDKLVTINQAMTIVGVSRRTIYNWLGSKKITYTRTAGGSIRIYAQSLFQLGLDPNDDDD